MDGRNRPNNGISFFPSSSSIDGTWTRSTKTPNDNNNGGLSRGSGTMLVTVLLQFPLKASSFLSSSVFLSLSASLNQLQRWGAEAEAVGGAPQSPRHSAGLARSTGQVIGTSSSYLPTVLAKARHTTRNYRIHFRIVRY